MVIDDFDIPCVAVAPFKTYSELIVDADAVLSGSVTGQFFQPVAGGNAKEVQRSGGVKLLKLADGSQGNSNKPGD
jgi:hypothetical protein